jgi:antitoxin (DNA-binding transcriptional repressor) of toxin-antitoxin stability system
MVKTSSGMESVSISDIRSRIQEVRRRLEDRGELILTSRGRPFALMIAAKGEDVEDLLQAVRRARAQLAVSRLRKQATQRGLDRMSDEEIEAEIQAARRAPGGRP